MPYPQVLRFPRAHPIPEERAPLLSGTQICVKISEATNEEGGEERTMTHRREGEGDEGRVFVKIPRGDIDGVGEVK